MKRMIENITGNYTASASVVDGMLILSLPDAITPVVWRLELGNVKASALEVRGEDAENFSLVLKTQRGDVNTVAVFASRGRAVAALMAVTRAMERTQRQNYPAANDADYNPSQLPVPVRGNGAKRPGAQGDRNVTGAVIALAVIAALIFVLLHMGPRTVMSQAAPAGQAKSAETAGVPVSADDFLKNR